MISVSDGIRHRRLEHADDRRRAVAEPDRLADHRRIARRASWSRSGASAPPRRPPSARRRSASSSRPSTGRRPITSKYEPPTTPARTTRGSPRPTIVKSIVREVAERGQRLDARPQVAGSPGTEKLAFSTPMPRRALADVDQPVLVAVDERPQQHAAHDAEDGGVGADAERQRDDHRDGQSLDPGQRAEGEAKVGDEAHTHPITRPRDIVDV